MARKLFENLEKPKVNPNNKDMRIDIAQDFERLKADSPAYASLMKALENMKDEANLQIQMTCGDKNGMSVYWKGRMSAIDEIQGFPERAFRKAVEASEESNMKSLV